MKLLCCKNVSEWNAGYSFTGLTAALSCPIRFNSGNTVQSIVIKQKLPPMTLDTGSARKTPAVPMWSV